MIVELAAIVGGLGGISGAGLLMQRWMDRVDKTVEAHGTKIDELRETVSDEFLQQAKAMAQHLAAETVFEQRLESMERKLPNGQLEKILSRLDDMAKKGS